MAMVQVWRCQICGGTYLGEEAPSKCAFCGADKRYIKLSSEYSPDINDVAVTDAEKADLIEAANLELTVSTFYNDLGEVGNRFELTPAAFRALARTEVEHLGVFSHLAGVDAPTTVQNRLKVQDTWEDNVALSTDHEKKVTKFYAEAAARATTPRVKEVFTAISEVERDHLDVDDYLYSATT